MIRSYKKSNTCLFIVCKEKEKMFYAMKRSWNGRSLFSEVPNISSGGKGNVDVSIEVQSSVSTRSNGCILPLFSFSLTMLPLLASIFFNIKSLPLSKPECWLVGSFSLGWLERSQSSLGSRAGSSGFSFACWLLSIALFSKYFTFLWWILSSDFCFIFSFLGSFLIYVSVEVEWDF